MTLPIRLAEVELDKFVGGRLLLCWVHRAPSLRCAAFESGASRNPVKVSGLSGINLAAGVDLFACCLAALYQRQFWRAPFVVNVQLPTHVLAKTVFSPGDAASVVEHVDLLRLRRQ